MHCIDRCHKQAGLLAKIIALSAFPSQGSVARKKTLIYTVAGPRRNQTGLPY